MKDASLLENRDFFCTALHTKMNQVAPVCTKMEPYEFRYSLNNITPLDGMWSGVRLETVETIEGWITSMDFFEKIQIKPKVDDHIVLDETITRLTQMLFTGLVTGDYSVDWVRKWFYFDPRGFNFYVRSIYLTDEIKISPGRSAVPCI